MNALVAYKARRLKPKRGLVVGDGEGGLKKGKLKKWKHVVALRYQQGVPARTKGLSSGDAGESLALSMVALTRDGKGGRMYSLRRKVKKGRRGSEGKEEDAGDEHLKGGWRRRKTKLSNVALLSLSENGRFAGAALAGEQSIRVYDLSDPKHRCVAVATYPERGVVRGNKGRVPAPSALIVADDGRAVLCQSRGRGGALWLWSDLGDGQGSQWRVLTAQGGEASSVDARFVRRRGGAGAGAGAGSALSPLQVDVKRVYCEQLDARQETDLSSVRLGLSFHQLAWLEAEGAYAAEAGHVYGLTLALDSSVPASGARAGAAPGGAGSVVDSVVQRWSPALGGGCASAVAVNFRLALTRTAPVVLLWDPYVAGRCTVARTGEALQAATDGARICDLAWTADGLFVGLALSDGSLCLLSCAGEVVRMVSNRRHHRHPRARLHFRHLEKYEKQGKVITMFGVAAHPSKAELTWCDGNSNLVYSELPTQGLLPPALGHHHHHHHHARLVGELQSRQRLALDCLAPFLCATATLIERSGLVERGGAGAAHVVHIEGLAARARAGAGRRDAAGAARLGARHARAGGLDAGAARQHPPRRARARARCARRVGVVARRRWRGGGARAERRRARGASRRRPRARACARRLPQRCRGRLPGSLPRARARGARALYRRGARAAHGRGVVPPGRARDRGGGRRGRGRQGRQAPRAGERRDL